MIALRASMATMKLETVGLALVMALSSLACSSGTLTTGNPGVAGTGGSAGAVAGTAGAGGMASGGIGSGVGGTAADGFLQPRCISDLIRACDPQDSCTREAGDAGAVANLCFASGVHAAFTSTPGSAGCGDGSIVTVTKADGTPCYSFESTFSYSMDCQGTRYAWRDAAGTVVATGFSNPHSNPTLTITCSDSGMDSHCNWGPIGGPGPVDSCCIITDLGTRACTSPNGSAGCTVGACGPTN